MWSLKIITVVAAFALTTASEAQTMSASNGGDSFAAGTTVTETYGAAGDVFAAGEIVSIAGVADGDVHVAGMDVNVDTETESDLYAMGATVTIGSNVAEDVTAMGYSVRLTSAAVVNRNARFLGRSVIIDGTVAGALSVASAEVTLNAPIGGDVRLAAEKISFGPNARIDGVLTYSAERPISIPERVISADRVQFEVLINRPMWQEMRETWDDVEMPILPTFVTLLSAFIVTLAFFILIGGIFLTFTPKHVASMRREITERPGHIFLLGILGLSMLFGLVPITALTIVGIPFVPFALLLIIVAWTLGYVLAAYAIAMRATLALGGPSDPSILVRLSVLAVAVCLVTLLNFIPFVGWVVNYTLVLLGIGAMASALFNWLIGNPGYAYDIDMKPIEN